MAIGETLDDQASRMTTSFGSLCHRQDRWYAAIFSGGQRKAFVSVLSIALSLIFMISAQVFADPALLSPEDALQRAKEGDVTIIDVRLPVEWAETGLPETAVGISLQDDETLQPRPGFIDDLLRQVDGNLDEPIALICATGNRSAFARKLLAANGFTQLYDVTEGMVGGVNGPGWLARELPTEPCSIC